MKKSYKWVNLFVQGIVILAIGVGASVSWASPGIDEDSASIKETIYAYFTLRYEALKANQPEVDYSAVTDDIENCSSEWLQMERDIRALHHFIHSVYEVTIIDYRFQLDFESIRVDGDEVVVRLRESNEIYYLRRPTEPSKSANIEHEIWLRRTENGWLITNDKYSDDFTRALEGSSLEALFEIVRKNHDHQRVDGGAEDQNPPNPSESTSIAGMEYYDEYDRIAAINYADAYWNSVITDGPVPQMILEMDGWDPDWDTTYKDYAWDCTNFVSQAVFEGVAYTASDPNYFYPDPANWSEWWYYKFSDPADGSKPWFHVRELREFLTVNYFNYEYFGLEFVIRGPTGKGVDLCDIQLGDVIFMYDTNEPDPELKWKHTVIVDKIDGDTCDGSNVSVAAHSDDAHERPLSEYSAFQWYPVEMKGYFDYKRVAFLPFVLNSSMSLAESWAQNPYPAPEGKDKRPEVTPVPNPYPAP